MRYALRSVDHEGIVGKVKATGLVEAGDEPFYYDTLEQAVEAANRRHQNIDGSSNKRWFALTIERESSMPCVTYVPVTYMF